MQGADIYQIAKNCRSSVEMIETYYASHLKNLLDTSSINVRRSKQYADLQEEYRLQGDAIHCSQNRPWLPQFARL